MSLDLVSETNPIGLVEPRKVAECNSAMGAVSNSINNFYIGTPKGGVNAELGELVHMFTKLDISKECTISFDVPSSAEDVPSRAEDAEDAEDDVEGKAEMGDAFSSGHVSDGISRGDGSDERKDGQKSLFGKKTSSEIDNMFNFLNYSVETYDRDSREIYDEHLSEVRTALKALNNQLETKSNFEKQQELKERIQHLSGLECLLMDFLAKFPKHTFANSESNNFAVHFVAVLSPRSNDGSPPTLRGWLILPTSMATKKFFSDQCRKGNIIFCHDIGLLNAHTSTEGMFKTLRKGAKNLMMEYGTIPNKDDDWYASMTAYGLMTRLAPLVHAASLEHSFPFEYAVYPVIDFFGTMNQYTGNLLKGHGDWIINYAGGRPVGQNPSLGRGLPPMRDVPCPQFQQNGAPRVQQRDEPQRAPNQLGGGGGGGGGPPILVPPVRHEQDPGGLAERFLDLPMALKALVTLARVQRLEDAFTPFSKSGYRIVIWSKKTEQTVKEAYLLLNQCEEEELGEIKSILMKRGFEAAGREQAKQRIKAIVRVGFNMKVQENFDKIFADSEKHPCRPLRVSVEEQSAIVGRAKKRRTDSAPFLAKALNTPFMTPAQLQTGKNVLIANHDDGKQNGNRLFNSSSSSSPNWKRKAPSWQSPSVARPSSKVTPTPAASSTPQGCQPCPTPVTSTEHENYNYTREHDGVKPYYKCGYPGCNIRGDFPCDVEKHIRQTHLKEKPFECSKCGDKFARNYDLTRHINNVHEENVEWHTCSVCNEKLKNETALANHMWLHAKRLPWSCTLCNYRSQTKGNTVRHVTRNHPEQAENPKGFVIYDP